MSAKQIIIFCAVALIATCLFAQSETPQKVTELSGTWFGDLNMTNPTVA